MRYEEAKEIIDCMEPRTGFRYFKDRYALMLLEGLHSAWRKPPRSLYMQLSKRFCMEKTSELPDLLANCRERQVKKILKDHKPEFWLLPDDINPVKAPFDHNETVH